MLHLARPRRRLVLAGGVALVLCAAAPVALARPLEAGHRNPHHGHGYLRTTAIIADTGPFGWATRQSNFGSGGAAIYGCRTGTLSDTPCLLADDLRTGPAFEFISHGAVGGHIVLADHHGAPFTTNATGVATGLNANYLQGHQASDFLGAKAQAADSAKLGGVAAAGYVKTGSLLFAVVAGNGTLGATRGATAAQATATDRYSVTFGANLSRCAVTATPATALSAGELGAAVDAGNPNQVDVQSPAALPQGFQLQVVC